MSSSAAPSGSVLDLGGLNHQEIRSLVDLVEKLSPLGVGKLVDFPRLIVLGE
jgi:hypothetical protein